MYLCYKSTSHEIVTWLRGESEFAFITAVVVSSILDYPIFIKI